MGRENPATDRRRPATAYRICRMSALATIWYAPGNGTTLLRKPGLPAPDDKKTLCPLCSSPRALSLTPAVRDWFCCGACGHIWPKNSETGTPTREKPSFSG